jgi:CheY-like chemotaxis protein
MTRNKTRVLIVDDEPSFTDMMGLTLAQAGRYETRGENDARRVMSAVQEFRPDVILLDVCMPELDGGEIQAQLMADPLTRDIPVIFLTALICSEEVPIGGMQSGGHLFLPKPVSCSELMECMQKALSERAAQSH